MDEPENRGRGWGLLCGCLAVICVLYFGAYFVLLEKTTSGLPRYSKSKAVNSILSPIFKPAYMIDRRVRTDFWGIEYDPIDVEAR